MIQIDVLEKVPAHNAVQCNLYTGSRCIKMYISISDYEALMKEGFFIRDGKKADSAGVINTTKTYIKPKSRI